MKSYMESDTVAQENKYIREEEFCNCSENFAGHKHVASHSNSTNMSQFFRINQMK